MLTDLDDLAAFAAVARAGGFRDAARIAGRSASGLSEAVSRLEARLRVRLLHRTTRSVAPTEAGSRLLERLSPALSEVAAALDTIHESRGRPAGTLKLNVPVTVSRLILPGIVPAFLAAYPEIHLEVVAEDDFVDILAAGCDAGIRYEERLERDMIAVPIGPRIQRVATAASPAYLARHGTPGHPRDLLEHQCLRGRFRSGVFHSWEFEQQGALIRIDPGGPLIVRAGETVELAVEAAIAGTGIIHLFEDWLRPHMARGALVPILEDWWQSFSGPFLYYPGRRHVPPPLRAFLDFLAGRKQA